MPLVGVTPGEVLAVPIAEMAQQAAGTDTRQEHRRARPARRLVRPRRRRRSSRGIRKKLRARRAPSVRRGQRARLRRWDASTRREHPLASRPHARSAAGDARGASCSPTATTCAPPAAIFAGCEFFGGYPITPSTEIMQFLSREIWKYGGAVLQAEDEIAGIGAARRRVVRRQEGDDRHLGPGHVAEDRDAGPGDASPSCRW